MISQHHFPGPPLSHFIERFWLVEDYESQHDRERVLPDGAAALVFSLREEPFHVFGERGQRRLTFRGGVVLGAHYEYFVLERASQEAVLGVRFRPGGAFPFMRKLVPELQNAHVSARDIWGDRADDVTEALLRATTPERRFAALEAFLLAQMWRGDRTSTQREGHPAVCFALRQFAVVPTIEIRTVAE